MCGYDPATVDRVHERLEKVSCNLENALRRLVEAVEMHVDYVGDERWEEPLAKAKNALSNV